MSHFEVHYVLDIQSNDVCRKSCDVTIATRTWDKLQPSSIYRGESFLPTLFVAKERSTNIREYARILQQRIDIITPEYTDRQGIDGSRFPSQQLFVNSIVFGREHDIVYIARNGDSSSSSTTAEEFDASFTEGFHEHKWESFVNERIWGIWLGSLCWHNTNMRHDFIVIALPRKYVSSRCWSHSYTMIISFRNATALQIHDFPCWKQTRRG